VGSSGFDDSKVLAVTFNASQVGNTDLHATLLAKCNLHAVTTSTAPYAPWLLYRLHYCMFN
jgi:hypothetical protein